MENSIHQFRNSKYVFLYESLPSMLWCCCLGGRKGIRLVKTEWWAVRVVICLKQGADLHMAQLMPLLLTVSCFSKIQIGFTFLVLAHPGSSGQRPKRVCVCVFLYVSYRILQLPVTRSAFVARNTQHICGPCELALYKCPGAFLQATSRVLRWWIGERPPDMAASCDIYK